MLTNIVILSTFVGLCLSSGMLFPRESESRQIHELNGFWNFRTDNSSSRDEGFQKHWYSRRLSKTGSVMAMPVPSSYNDITTDRTLRDFVGWAWYDREFYPSSDWAHKRVVLRFDSVHYNAIVWVNGVQVMEHEGGHLPFEAAINGFIEFGKRNYITVAVNNTLTPTTLPPGTIEYMHNSDKYPPGYFVQNLQFDFFNYAGIHRRVRLYTTPLVHVDDITINTNIQGAIGVVDYDIEVKGGEPNLKEVQILDADENVVGQKSTLKGTFMIQNAHLWWPYTMNKEAGYQYTMKVTVQGPSGVNDTYRQLFGIRTVRTNDHQILINDRPFYCHGVNKHEDADIRGKGLDHAIFARDFHMMKWLGANCFRTSHYPYAEEFMDEADKQGFVVIDECPGVGITKASNMGPVSLAHHMEVMTELIRRDKNRPAVVMWSVANEPGSELPEADDYFRTVIEHTRNITNDTSYRLVTFVCNQDFNRDRIAKYVDVLCINRYYGWYSDMGHLEVIPYQLRYDLEHWYDTVKKPLIISEYGADTVPGLNSLPSQMFTEDFQLEFNQAYHDVFDEFRQKYLVGELIWNFADFMTSQSTTRVVGNKKGILSRTRQPKMVAYNIRQRYWNMQNETLTAFYSRQNKMDVSYKARFNEISNVLQPGVLDVL